MDMLKRELERKKKTVQKAKAASGGRRFFKAGELRRQEEEEEEEKHSKWESSRKRKWRSNQGDDDDDGPSSDGKSSKKKQDSEDDARERKSKKGGKKGDQAQADSKDEEATTNNAEKGHGQTSFSKLSLEELIEKLRSFGLPIKLFGESFDDRVKRLRSALDEQSKTQGISAEMEEFRLGRGHGIRNTFLGKDEEDVTGAVGDSHHEESAAAAKDEGDANDDAGDLADDSDPHKRVYKYFKGLLKGWEDDLVQRPDAVKRSVAGRNETKTLKQCKDYIRPMFKLLKSRRMDESILAKLNRIVSFCLEEEFVKAHDTYIDISIGRAAWPIGVTMVGIHARTGRAKIESSNVAHVMNSELQRKYLTSVKRLMTYAQKKSAADPSKKVL